MNNFKKSIYVTIALGLLVIMGVLIFNKGDSTTMNPNFIINNIKENLNSGEPISQETNTLKVVSINPTRELSDPIQVIEVTVSGKINNSKDIEVKIEPYINLFVYKKQDNILGIKPKNSAWEDGETYKITVLDKTINLKTIYAGIKDIKESGESNFLK